MNKKKIIALIFIILLISLVVGFLWPKKSGDLPNQTTTTSSQAQKATTTIKKQITTTTMNPVLEKALIESIEKDTPDYASADLKAIASKRYGDWLISTVERLDVETDPANVIYKLEGESWVVIDGPGTSFDIEYLERMGAPEEVLDKANYIPIDGSTLEP